MCRRLAGVQMADARPATARPASARRICGTMAFMRQPDRPEAGRSDDDSQPGGRGQAADLSARLLRLPAGHPSGDRGTPGAAGDSRGSGRSLAGRHDREPERENWRERGPGPQRSGLKDWRSWPDRDADDQYWPGEWEDSGAGACESSGSGGIEDPESGERQGGADDGDDATAAEDDLAGDTGRHAGPRGGRGWLGEHGGGPAGAPAAGRGPYRPWFAGDSAQPWFATDSDDLLGSSGSLPAGADGPL